MNAQQEQRSLRTRSRLAAPLGISAVTLIAPLAILLSASPAGAVQTPPDTGCPAGYDTLSVAALTALGYGVPARVDDPANGGNGDGIVCGKPFSDAATTHLCGSPCPAPIFYRFGDNRLTH